MASPMEALHVKGSNLRWIALTGLVFAAALTACGSSSPTATTGAGTQAPTSAAATPTAVAAAASCPSGATVGSALGTTVPDAVGVAGGGSTQLPGGATGMVCDYHASTENVIIVVITNIPATYIAQFSSHFPGGYKTVSGVGDQARSFSQSLGPGKDNLGVVATKGSTLVAITATYTPASLESGRGPRQPTAVGTRDSVVAAGWERRRPGIRRSTTLSARVTGGSPSTHHVSAPHAAPIAAPTITSLT